MTQVSSMNTCLCPAQPQTNRSWDDSQFSQPWYKAKSIYMADAKSTISTTLFDSSGPDYQQSSTGSGTTPLDHLSFTNSQNKQSRLRILGGMIRQKQRSCSLLTAEVRNRERLYNQALLINRSNFKMLKEKCKSQLLELDQIEKAVEAWERARQSRRPLVFKQRSR